NDGNITLYSWNFGDGINATGKIVSHTYLHYGTYNATLIVTDDDGNQDTETKNIPIRDFIFPVITDHTPTIGYTGSSFTFNATITDNDQVTKATVEYWYGSGTHTNVSMTNIAGNYWVKTITIANTLNILHYFISAKDPANNWKSTPIKNIAVIDNVNPTFTDNSPTHGTTGDSYTFDVTASDNVGVQSVKVTWTHANLDGINTSLNPDGDGTWSLTITLDNSLNAMIYRITVTDTFNNKIIGPQKTVTVTDNDKPLIVDHTPPVAHAGDQFTFNATVTDNILVSSVWVEYWFDSGSHINTSMTKIGVNHWEKTITINLTSVTLRYIISTVDSSGNWMNTGIVVVNIGPDYPPSTPQKPSSTTTGYADKSYIYTTNATDPNNDQIYYRWDWGDGNYSIWLGPYNSGQVASASHVWAKGNYSIKVKAKDALGLESGWSDPLTIRMIENFKPIFTNESPANNSNNLPISTSTLSVFIQDPEGDHFNWTITTSPNVGSSSGTNANNGTKNCNITNLGYSTIYTWNVKVCDGVHWTNQTYRFTTISNGGGGGGGGSETPPSGPQNKKPIANASAGEPYQGFVNTEITFDGTRSNDPDGNITKWFWVFGDNTNGTGKTIRHSYKKVGTYTVTLMVTDNEGATNTDTTTVVITQPNRPPTKPIITGPTNGMKNTMYTFTAVSTDLDNDTINYRFDWGEPISPSSGYLPNGTSFTVNHSWTSAGRYSVIVTVTDNQTESSSKITVYIDAVQTGDIGYLTDDNGDGSYDTFHNGTTSQNTIVSKTGSNYLIDSNGDGIWDYTFDALNGLTTYQEPSKTPGFENVLFIGVFIAAVICGFIVAVVLWKKKKIV
ncbi:MAG: PKD domain-containing protein, partial [Euryarchaeota archaeon]|nr:PKD domain-containing protein [Euryarchaeota archaeon]